MNNTICGFGIEAQKHLKAAESIYTDGCADRAATWVESHLLLVGTLVLGLALPQVAHTTIQASYKYVHLIGVFFFF